jgi:hypothetical protein
MYAGGCGLSFSYMFKRKKSTAELKCLFSCDYFGPAEALRLKMYYEYARLPSQLIELPEHAVLAP